MQRLEVSGAVRPIYRSLGVKRLNRIQLDATVCSLIYLNAKSLYVFRVSQHPSSGVLKTVTAASNVARSGHVRGK